MDSRWREMITRDDVLSAARVEDLVESRQEPMAQLEGSQSDAGSKVMEEQKGSRV